MQYKVNWYSRIACLPLFLLSNALQIGLTSPSLDITKVDVLDYRVFIEPNLTTHQIKGNVLIKFKSHPLINTVTFDSGNLTVTELKGDNTTGFQQIGNKLIVGLVSNDSAIYTIDLSYQGTPQRGLIFLDNPTQAYTVYFTSEWMICNNAPDDRATINLDILVPNQYITIANGDLVATSSTEDDKTLYSWIQSYETPRYTFGFAVGTFNEIHQNHDGVSLNYYSANHTPLEITSIFKLTPDMMSFFEEKSGIPFPQKTYSQVLIGNHFQEMSGFTVLKQSYGALILKDSTETNLISHELAHQWWGNMVTCKSWNHFWLNEGMATFMSAAYNEHRFGRKKYQKDIDSYFAVFDEIRSKRRDKPLVFTDWSNPTSEDRNLVYFKGAYVLHLLRSEIGEANFWKGIKVFTQNNYGKSVVTRDFQLAMESASNRDLKEFFHTWVY